MPKELPLFALQRDLDMVIDDVQNLKHSYNLLDYIAKVVRDCHLEQLAQGAQMRRMEETMQQMSKRMETIEADVKELKQDVAVLKQDVASLKQAVGRLDKDMKRVKTKLAIK